MRGTVAKRLRRRAKGIYNSEAWADKIITGIWKKEGLSDEAIERKYYLRSKKQYKYWRRYPGYIGTF